MTCFHLKLNTKHNKKSKQQTEQMNARNQANYSRKLLQVLRITHFGISSRDEVLVEVSTCKENQVYGDHPWDGW